MAATTANAVREEFATLVEALTPTSIAGDTFGRYEGEKEFRDFARAAGRLAFRKFEIRYGAPEFPLVVNGPTARYRYPFTLEVAYPSTHYGTAVDPPRLDVDRVIDEDQGAIYEVLRDQSTDAAWINDEAACERELDEDGQVVFLRFEATYEFFRTV